MSDNQTTVDRGQKDTHGGECCCNCAFLLKDFHHPTTTGKSTLVQRGWICAPPEFDGMVFSGWSQHGLCEMWQQRR